MAINRQSLFGQPETFTQILTRTLGRPLHPEQATYCSRSYRSTLASPCHHDYVNGVGAHQHHGHRRPPYRDPIVGLEARELKDREPASLQT
jgi:hypothetical protein